MQDIKKDWALDILFPLPFPFWARAVKGCATARAMKSAAHVVRESAITSCNKNFQMLSGSRKFACVSFEV
jgi:hypothetical protein